MQKISTMRTSEKNIFQGQLTIGLDLGDRSSAYCVLNEAGEIVLEHKLATTPEAMKQVFGSMPRCRMAMETGTHSPWVSRLLTALGHEVIVAHAQKVRLITKSRRKDDRLDARTLARLVRIDPELLTPVKHRSAQGAVAPDGDPSTSGTGERANRSGECRTRIGEVLRRTAAQVWYGTVPSGDREWIKRGIA
ncbi:MAG: transposase [Candidatus Acidiferrum sp.]